MESWGFPIDFPIEIFPIPIPRVLCRPTRRSFASKPNCGARPAQCRRSRSCREETWGKYGINKGSYVLIWVNIAVYII